MSEEMQSEEVPAPLSAAAPGQQLAEAREARGWSIAEMAMRLKFSARQIEALEADVYGALPGATIVRGMVRSYAKALGLDPQPLVIEVERRLNADPLTIMSTPSLRVPIRGRTKKVQPVYALLAILLLLGAGAWGIQHWLTSSPASAPVATEAPQDLSAPEAGLPLPVPVDAPTDPIELPVPQQSAAAAQLVAAVTPGRKRIELQFNSAAWVEIKDGEGKMLMAQLNHAQTQTVLEGKPPFALIIGNASSVQVKYEGNPVDLGPMIRSDVARITLN